MQAYTAYLTKQTKQMYVDPLDDEDVANFLDSVELKYM